MQQSLFDFDNENKFKGWFADALSTLGIDNKPGWPDIFGNALIKWNSENKINPIKVLSLFSGAGGLDIGFHDAGFQIVECNEIEADFAATLIENSQKGKRLYGSKVVCMDINEYDPILSDIDFIIGGPPCQTFSAAGARAAGVNGTDDERGNLFWQYVRILKKIQPRGFLFENVYRIVGAQGGKPWKEIQRAFNDAGYTLFWRILDAADFGVPQFRERLIIVGIKQGNYKFPSPTHGPDSLDKRDYYTSSFAIDGVMSNVQGSTIGGRHGHLLNDIPPGLNYSFYTERMGHPKPIFGWRSKFSDYLYKADPDTPVRTIKAQGGQYTGPFHWDNRTFTIEELKRLQTFPDTYSIVGTRQKVIHQLGNSVPPQLSRILALSILKQVFHQNLPFELQLLLDSHSLGFRARKSRLTKIYAKKAADAIASLPLGNVKLLKKDSQKAYGSIGDNLLLLLRTQPKSADFCFEHTLYNGKLNLKVWCDDKAEGVKYKYFINSNRLSVVGKEIDSIEMVSYSDDPRSVLALWKYLETVVKKYMHKDDLVQLFGYYQYKQKYSIKLKLIEKSLSKNDFWNVLVNISAGHFVRKISDIDKLSFEFGLEKDRFTLELKKLKRLGFEIRSHNTNKQIRKGMILIPYSFPSLNERSLQRLTEL